MVASFSSGSVPHLPAASPSSTWHSTSLGGRLSPPAPLLVSVGPVGDCALLAIAGSFWQLLRGDCPTGSARTTAAGCDWDLVQGELLPPPPHAPGGDPSLPIGLQLVGFSVSLPPLSDALRWALPPATVNKKSFRRSHSPRNVPRFPEIPASLKLRCRSWPEQNAARPGIHAPAGQCRTLPGWAFAHNAHPDKRWAFA